MPTVARHAIDVDFARSQVDTFERLVASALSDVDRSGDALGTARRRTLLRMGYLLAGDPAAADEESWRAAVLASQVANAVFVASGEAEGTVTYEIGEPRSLPALGPNRLSTPVDWITAACLAVITQSERRIQELCSVAPATMAATDSRFDDYVDPWVQTLRTFLRHDPVPPELFRTVMERTDPDSLQYMTREFMLRIAYPPIKMFYYVLRRDTERLNDALVQALTLHRDYWSTGELAGDPHGFLALGPLAIAILARAVGMPIEVESDYLPANLLNGRWVGR